MKEIVLKIIEKPMQWLFAILVILMIMNWNTEVTMVIAGMSITATIGAIVLSVLGFAGL